MRTMLAVAVAAMLTACGGTDDSGAIRDAECAAECGARAESGSGVIDPSMVSAAYCPGFCGGGGECRCILTSWLQGRLSVCEASEMIVCPGR